MQELRDVPTFEGCPLDPSQVDGWACVRCGINFLTTPVSSVPAGFCSTGAQVFTCLPCRAAAEAPAAGDCRIRWCQQSHQAPGPDQVYVMHRAQVAETTRPDETAVEVLAWWGERLDARPSAAPAVVVDTHSGDDTTAMDLDPGTAGALAEVLAVTDPGSWFGGALAEAARRLGYVEAGEDAL